MGQGKWKREREGGRREREGERAGAMNE